jgi:hypothetical protein
MCMVGQRSKYSHWNKCAIIERRNDPARVNAGAVRHRSKPVPTLNDNIPMRRCAACGAELPATTEYFNKHGGTLRTTCRTCRNATRRASREPHREEINAHKRALRADNLEYERERDRRRYERDKENRRAWFRSYDNTPFRREKHRQYSRNAYKRNPGMFAIKGQRYRLAHPEIIRAKSNRYRARKFGNGGKHTGDDLIAIRAAQTDNRGRLICWRCGKPIKGASHLDHWIPLAKGGTDDPGNLHYMHAKCNLNKSSKHPTEIGRLI